MPQEWMHKEIYLVDVVGGPRADLSPLFQVSFCGVPGQRYVLNFPLSEFLHEIEKQKISITSRFAVHFIFYTTAHDYEYRFSVFWPTL